MTPDETYDYINILRDQGNNVLEIKADLAARGLSDGEINAALQLSTDKQNTSNKSKGKGQIIAGVLFISCGVLVTVATFVNALQMREKQFYIFYWPMILGAVLLFKGISNYRNTTKDKPINTTIIDDGV